MDPNAQHNVSDFQFDDDSIEEKKKMNRDFSIKDLINKSKEHIYDEGDVSGRKSLDSDLAISPMDDSHAKHARDNTFDNFSKSEIRYTDNSYMDNELDDKIKKQMEQLKVNKDQDDTSQILASDIGDRESYLDYTLDKSNLLIKKDKKYEAKDQKPEEDPRTITEQVEESGTAEEMNTFLDNPNDDEEDDKDDNMILDMNQLAAEGEDDDYNVKFGSNEGGLHRGNSVPAKHMHGITTVIDQDNIDEDQEEEELFGGTQEPEKRYARDRNTTKERSSLRMIDKVNSEKVEDLKKIKTKIAAENELERVKSYKREVTFKGNDTSVDRTYVDGSVIIHGGNDASQIDLNCTPNTGDFANNSALYNTYYGNDDNPGQKNINVS